MKNPSERVLISNPVGRKWLLQGLKDQWWLPAHKLALAKAFLSEKLKGFFCGHVNNKQRFQETSPYKPHIKFFTEWSICIAGEQSLYHYLRTY